MEHEAAAGSYKRNQSEISGMGHAEGGQQTFTDGCNSRVDTGMMANLEK